jgi:hypothetical protein
LLDLLARLCDGCLELLDLRIIRCGINLKQDCSGLYEHIGLDRYRRDGAGNIWRHFDHASDDGNSTGRRQRVQQSDEDREYDAAEQNSGNPPRPVPRHQFEAKKQQPCCADIKQVISIVALYASRQAPLRVPMFVSRPVARQ